MLAIVGGKLCCVVSLVPCTSGTTLYSTTAAAGAVGTVIKYSGNCYTVTTTATCGTIVTGPFTTVANCAACNVCPTDCGGLASSYAVGGFDGFVNAACNAVHDNTCAGTGYPAWDDQVHLVNGPLCSGGPEYDIIPGNACFGQLDGTTSYTGTSTLSCNPGGGAIPPYWVFSLNYQYGSHYFKVGGATPVGTYTLATTANPDPGGFSSGADCADGVSYSAPATITIS